METLAYIFMGFGSLFFLGATLGILRFPDFYTRMHAAGKGDTLSSLLFLAAWRSITSPMSAVSALSVSGEGLISSPLCLEGVGESQLSELILHQHKIKSRGRIVISIIKPRRCDMM